MIVDLEQLWKEFEKAIKAGNWDKFTTKDGFRKYLKKRIKQAPGIECHFTFVGERKRFKAILPITLSLLQELGIALESL